MSETPVRVAINTDTGSPENDGHAFGLIESPYSRLYGSNSEGSPLLGPFPDQELNDQEEIKASIWDSWKKLFYTRSRYYIPVLAWVPKYAIDQVFKQDLIAGISVAFLIIPQVCTFTIYKVGIIVCSSVGQNSSHSWAIHCLYTIDIIYVAGYVQTFGSRSRSTGVNFSWSIS
jgi:hypothetical protein